MNTLLVILAAIVGFIIGTIYQKRKGLEQVREEWAKHFLDYIEKNKEKIDSGEENPFNKI